MSPAEFQHLIHKTLAGGVENLDMFHMETSPEEAYPHINTVSTGSRQWLPQPQRFELVEDRPVVHDHPRYLLLLRLLKYLRDTEEGRAVLSTIPVEAYALTGVPSSLRVVAAVGHLARRFR